ncbi:hypothetical protein [Brucella anthropi]|uniref:Uncharacterized protein n=1 Tax=Brucella anthropi TaxID=529 RepID=A0A6L3Z5L1_BRUAN|nr:hypothetical protein [Brucella anthropi]KAB2768648.1 hypothetical protein F9L04_13310 [Brucella anthropi]
MKGKLSGWFCVWMLLLVSVASADNAKIFREAMFKSMAGFSGIFLSCRQNPENNPIGALVCGTSVSYFNERSDKFRIKHNHLPFGLPQKERTDELLSRMRKLGSPLGLVVELSYAETPEGYVGSARLSAEVSMGFGVDLSVPKGAPTTRPRSGTLVFWDRESIASGDTPERLAYILNQAVKLNMDAFFAEYMKENQ